MEKYKEQVYWVGDDKKTKNLKDWFAYVCRNPLLPGHIIIENRKQEIYNVPKGLERALRVNIKFILKWSCINKGKDCLPVFFRMNIAKEDFRIHVIPLSEQERLEATRSLHSRHPQNKKQGGFLFYLGKKEDIAEKCIEEYNKADKKKTLELLKGCGVTETVKQLRKIVKGCGFRSRIS